MSMVYIFLGILLGCQYRVYHIFQNHFVSVRRVLAFLLSALITDIIINYIILYYINMVSLPLPSVCVSPSLSICQSVGAGVFSQFVVLYVIVGLVSFSAQKYSFSSCDSLLGLDSLPPHPLICVISPYFYISVPLIYSESDENFKVLICQMMCHDIFLSYFLSGDSGYYNICYFSDLYSIPGRHVYTILAFLLGYKYYAYNIYKHHNPDSSLLVFTA